jgi:hypothetical protein
MSTNRNELPWLTGRRLSALRWIAATSQKLGFSLQIRFGLRSKKVSGSATLVAKMKAQDHLLTEPDPSHLDSHPTLSLIIGMQDALLAKSVERCVVSCEDIILSLANDSPHGADFASLVMNLYRSEQVLRITAMTILQNYHIILAANCRNCTNKKIQSYEQFIKSAAPYPFLWSRGMIHALYESFRYEVYVKIEQTEKYISLCESLVDQITDELRDIERI